VSPLVSVIVPAYRAQPTILRCLRSLVAQTLPAWEALVVSDDGVDYAALLAEAGFADARVRYLGSGGMASGAQRARNCGLKAARGTFVAPLDADDLYRPRRLERLLPLAQAEGAAFDGVEVVEEESGRALGRYYDAGGATVRIEPAELLDLPVPMMPLVRRDWVAGWDPAIELCDDVAFNLRLFARLAAIPLAAEPLHEYRVRDGSICHSPDSAERAERGYSALLARLEADGYGLHDAALIRLAQARIEAKRDLNRAFRRAYATGAASTFEEFVETTRQAAGVRG